MKQTCVMKQPCFDTKSTISRHGSIGAYVLTVVGLASRSSADWRSHSWLVAKYGIVCRIWQSFLSRSVALPSLFPFSRLGNAVL